MSVRYPDHVPGRGMHVVGVDIAPGIYRCAPGRDGFWVRYPGSGERLRYRAEDPEAARVQVEPHDVALETHVQGEWRSVHAAGPDEERVSLPRTSGAPRTRMVVDPALPGHVAELLRGNSHLMTVARNRAVDAAARRPHGDKGQWWLSALVIMPAAIIVSAVSLGEQGVGAGAVAGLVFSVLFSLMMAAGGGRLGGSARVRRDLIANCADRVILAEDLDSEARSLLCRAQVAIAAITDSRVHAEGLIDSAKNAVMLPDQEWEIARSLAEITRLSGEVEAMLRVASTSEVEGRALARRGELESRRRSVAERVKALEAYAERVQEADRVRRAEEHLKTLAAREADHGELLAGSVRDELATREINALTAEAEDLCRRLGGR